MIPITMATLLTRKIALNTIRPTSPIPMPTVIHTSRPFLINLPTPFTSQTVPTIIIQTSQTFIITPQTITRTGQTPKIRRTDRITAISIFGKSANARSALAWAILITNIARSCTPLTNCWRSASRVVACFAGEFASFGAWIVNWEGWLAVSAVS